MNKLIVSKVLLSVAVGFSSISTFAAGEALVGNYSIKTGEVRCSDRIYIQTEGNGLRFSYSDGTYSHLVEDTNGQTLVKSGPVKTATKTSISNNEVEVNVRETARISNPLTWIAARSI